MPLQTISLDDGYVRPDKTYTESLNPAIISSQLHEYRELPDNDFTDVHLGSNIKYFIKKDGKYLYRIGGTLTNKSCWDTDGYVVLMSAYGKKWCVQLDKTIIFVRMNNTELRKSYENKIRERKKYLLDLKDALYREETKNRIIPHYLLKEPNFIKLLIPRLSRDSIKNLRTGQIHFIDTQQIDTYHVVVGYDPTTKELTDEIEVTGTEVYRKKIIGLRYVSGIDAVILPTASYRFILVGNHEKKFKQIVMNL